jgi:perosamine synthetase
MDKILAIARRHNLHVVEDCAHGCGGEYLLNGRTWKKLGSMGDAGCFSFHAVKNLATGDGGMITTDSDNFNERLRKSRWMGITKDTWNRSSKTKGYSWYYDVTKLGFKCHMNDITAVIGLVQLNKLEKMNKKRKELSKKYSKAFSKVSCIETPVIKPYARSAHHNYVVKVPRRNELIEYLKSKGIAAGMHYIPNHHYDMYKSFKADTLVTDKVWEKLVTLPLYPDMTASDFNKVVKAVTEFYK